MSKLTTKPDSTQPATEMAVGLFDNWFDPLETEVMTVALDAGSCFIAGASCFVRNAAVPARLAGTNTRRVRRALAALFGGTVGKDTVSRTWRKVKGDWDA
jgi:hypothetical protein